MNKYSNFVITSIHTFIALLITITTIYIIPDNFFDKYRLKLLKSENQSAYVFYHDFNNDNISERVSVSLQDLSQTIDIALQKKSGTFAPYQLFYALSPDAKFIGSYVFFDDFDKNGKSEIYFFESIDTVCVLEALEADIKNKKFDILFRKAITPHKYFSGAIDLQLKNVVFKDLDKDGYDEICFILDAGYSVQPRNIYIYNIKKDTLISTPLTSIEYDSFQITDLDNDGNYEFIVNNQATGNTFPLKIVESWKNSADADTQLYYKYYKHLGYEYGDYAAYILVLNDKLRFKFPPIPYDGWTNIAISEPFTDKKIITAITTRRDTNLIPKFIVTDINGKIIKTKEFPEYKLKGSIHLWFDKEENLLYAMGESGTEVFDIFDTTLTRIKSVKKPPYLSLSGNIMDINEDGTYERIGFDNKTTVFYISSLDFNYIKTLQLNLEPSPFYVFNKLKYKDKKFLHFQNGKKAFLIKYWFNWIYYLKIPVYLLIFVVWYFLLHILIKLNKARLEKENMRLEKIIAERTRDISEKNKELTKQKHEIEAINEELKQMLEEIMAQRDQIQDQKNKLEKIHSELSQSIDYAKKLQKSIFPDKDILKKDFNEYFTLFLPKDKVSGDFYWWTKINDDYIITVADCTGHGVPGAFMSMLGISFLREIVEENKETNPENILYILRNEVIRTLKQTGSRGESKDGMDMGIIKVETGKQRITFAGANLPAYFITDKDTEFIPPEKVKAPKISTENSGLKLYELKPDKMPIAFYYNMDKFTSVSFNYNKGDMIYLFSDGFIDQFGGKQGKKFKTKAFKKLLLDISVLNSENQYKILYDTFFNWKMNNEQIDDVTVLGIRL